MATPTVRAIREAFPEARLDFFVGSWSKHAVIGNPHVDNVVDCGNVGAGRYGIAEYLALVQRLRHGSYDACFVLERSVFVALLPLLAGIPQRIGLDSEGRGFSLSVKVPCGEVKHEVELYLDTLRAIGVDVGHPRLEFHLSDGDIARAYQLLQEAGLAVPRAEEGDRMDGPNRPVVAIHPAGGANPGMELLAKRWPVERFAAIADKLIDDYGATVLVVGAESDASVAAQMAREMRGRSVDLAGKTTIGELAAILALCDLFVGNDTGPLHLAVAVGTPVVAVFGPTDARVYGPYSDEATVVAGDVPCRPCFQKGTIRHCATYECVSAVSVGHVWEAVQERLEARGLGKSSSPGK